MALVENDRFTIPLYHGTTGLFIDSIKESGLGGKDPLVEFGTKRLFLELFEFADNKLERDENWKEYREFLKPTADQLYLGGNFSFKHGETYLTYNSELAIKYACENVCGCEHLTNLKKLIFFLDAKRVDDLKDFADSPIIKIIEKPYDPFVITLNDVKVENVETETGKEMKEQLEEIEKNLNIGLMGPESFKLKRPIYKEDFTDTRLAHYSYINNNWEIKWEEGEFTDPSILNRILDLQ